jgi:hypothetical protein
MIKLRKVLKDLHRAELIAAKEHARIRAARGQRRRRRRHQCTEAAHLGPRRPEGERRRQAQARE